MLEQLTLEGVRGVIEAQMHPTNLELNVAGDFDPEELEALVLRYLGKPFVFVFCLLLCMARLCSTMPLQGVLWCS
jgi:hypothetical protein